MVDTQEEPSITKLLLRSKTVISKSTPKIDTLKELSRDKLEKVPKQNSSKYRKSYIIWRAERTMSRRQERTMSSSPYGERDSPRLARHMANGMISPARHIWRAGQPMSSSPYDERDGPCLARHMTSGMVRVQLAIWQAGRSNLNHYGNQLPFFGSRLNCLLFRLDRSYR